MLCVVLDPGMLEQHAGVCETPELVLVWALVAPVCSTKSNQRQTAAILPRTVGQVQAGSPHPSGETESSGCARLSAERV